MAALQLFKNLGFGLLPLAPSLRSWNTACAGQAAWGWFGLWPYVFSCLGVGAALPLDACAMNSSSRVLSWRAGARLVTGGDPRSRVPPRDPRIFCCVLYVVLPHRGSMHRTFNAEWLCTFFDLSTSQAVSNCIPISALQLGQQWPAMVN